MDKDQARQTIQALVEAFLANRAAYTHAYSDYNETQLRTDFLNPFLAALGWDVFNAKRAPQHLREVVHEDSVEVEDADAGAGAVFTKKPDYALRLGATRKFFVEAKRPAVAVDTNPMAAFQARRYGWNARLPMVVLTNFDKLILYDSRIRPQVEDDVRVARLKIYDSTEYVARFDELYAQISREAVYSGAFDAQFESDAIHAGAETFDEYFLNQIETWRAQLAQDIITQNATLTQPEINFGVQRLLNRIIFLRICEDRELERYQTLQGVQSYEALKSLFLQADARYNSGLFDFIEDQLSFNITVSSDVLISIFQALYYPASPYAFSVVGADILGQIYERFLARHIALEQHTIVIQEKPEIAASQGVVPTPESIVAAIVQKTLGPLCARKSPAELASLRIADIACGSGPFLLKAYDYLLAAYLEAYLREGGAAHSDKLYEGSQHTWHLTLQERNRILCEHIFGADIDPQAVEIARFSLLLKALEDVPVAAIAAYQQRHARALPNLDANVQCGNSLVDSAYFEYDAEALTDAQRFTQINPLDWATAFPQVFARGGFDAIVGNPPYIRIQNMVRYAPQEARYYQSEASPYTCAQSDNFDKYSLFIERALSLLNPTGRFGYIVPHKFFTLKSGQALRKLLAEGQHVVDITHFGVQQVFGARRSTYTCILSLTKQAAPRFTVEHVSDLAAWQRGVSSQPLAYSADYLGATPWKFVSPAARALFERLRAEHPTQLEQLATIFVGVQTSADKIYILKPLEENEAHITFVDVNGVTWDIEKGVLRPCLLDVALPAFSRPQANACIIFPYRIENQRAHLFTPAQMQENFPRCWAYLNAHKAQLEQRSIQGGTADTWYRYGRSQSLTRFDGAPKLIWPVLSLEARYAYDDQDILFTGGGNGPYYGLRLKPQTALSIHYLQALLSHPVIEAMVRAVGSAFRGGYYSHGKQFIKDLPVRLLDLADPQEKAIHDTIVARVAALIAANERAADATIPLQRQQAQQQAQQLQRAIERQIAELYNLNETDLAAIGVLQEGEIL